jgi:hypothetical protein
MVMTKINLMWHRPIRPSQKADLEMREVRGNHSLGKDLEAVVAQAVPASS